MTLRLRTFGAVYLERDRAPLGGAHTQRRRLALLAYLAAADRAVVTRDKLIALLWPESDEGSGRHALSQLVYAIRRDLGADAIVAEKETVALNHAVIASDVRAFDEALRVGKLEDVARQFRGPFLDGFHLDDAPELERWIEEERARRDTLCARSLERLAGEAEQRGDQHAAIDWWRRRAALTPTDGRATLHLMRALAAIGDRAGAVQAARVYETLVREELEAEPDRAVTALAGELRRAPTVAPDEGIATAGASATWRPGPDVAIAAPRETGSREVGAASVAPPARPESSARRSWRWPAVVAAAVAILLVVATRRQRGSDVAAALPQAGSLAMPARVVLGDLAGPDTVLALAVREALRAELSNASGVVLASELGVRELRSLMRIPAESALRPPRLLDVATRSGAHVAVAGSVVPLGAGAQVLLDLLDPSSGRTLGTLAERSRDDATLMAAVERLGRALRGAISRTPPDTAVRALPAVTTPSLPALKSYALARQAAARGLRAEAVEHGERAVLHDTSFVLAHYLVGDLLWFLDQQGHAEAHLTRAYELRETVPVREQLAIRARYEQLVRDRPDSALTYWELFRDAAPADPLGYEGRSWALRALGRHEEAAAAADTAMRLDAGAVVPNTNNAIYSWLAVGDTASALEYARRLAPRHPGALLEARFYAALFRGDLAAALAMADSEPARSGRAFRRQLASLARRDVEGARAALDSMRADDRLQFVPRALVNQGWGELTVHRDRRAAARYARETLAWLRPRDLSPPAVARIAERTGDLAARAGDVATVQATIALVRQRDRGRNLRSYVLAQRTLDAALAYAHRDFRAAARLAANARHGVYFWRSLVTIVKLEADARRAAGEAAAADSLDALIASHQIVDGDFEIWALLRAVSGERSADGDERTAHR